MVVDHFRHRAADDLAHPLNHPFPARVGIPPGESHRGDITAPELAVLVHDGGRDVHAFLAASGFEVAGRARVA